MLACAAPGKCQTPAQQRRGSRGAALPEPRRRPAQRRVRDRCAPRGSPRAHPVPGGAELRCAGRGHDACQHAQRPAGLPALLRRVQPGARRPPDWAARIQSDWAAPPRARRRSAARQALREPAPPLPPALPRRCSHASKLSCPARRRTPARSAAARQAGQAAAGVQAARVQQADPPGRRRRCRRGGCWRWRTRRAT